MLLNLAISVLNADMGACAQTTSENGGSCGGLESMWGLVLPLVMVLGLFIWMTVSNRNRDKKVKDMLGSLKPGDRVRTIGGIYGTISSIKDDVVILSVGPEKVKLVFARGAISQVEDTGVENTMTEEVKD